MKKYKLTLTDRATGALFKKGVLQMNDPRTMTTSELIDKFTTITSAFIGFHNAEFVCMENNVVIMKANEPRYRTEYINITITEQ